MTTQDDIISFLKVIGPTIPSKVAKHIGTDIIIASAHLSQMASDNKIKISKLKIGGTPLYYLATDVDKLFDFAAGNMNSKDYEVLKTLKEMKILRESSLDLLHKVALRQLKDFAVPLQVTIRGETELFWKWHLFDETETNMLIKEIIFANNKAINDSLNHGDEQRFKETIREAAGVDVVDKSKLEDNRSLEDYGREDNVNNYPYNALQSHQNLKSDIVPRVEQKNESVVLENQKVELEGLKAVEAIPHEIERDFKNNSNQIQQEEVVEDSINQKSLSKEEELINKNSEELLENNVIDKEKVKEEFLKEIEEQKKKKRPKGDFILDVEEYFESLKINIEDIESSRKNSELVCIITIPSAVGKLKFFCKARRKAKCDEKDLSSAYMEAQVKKLPLLFVYSDELNKKAQEISDSNAFENMVVRRLGE